MGRRDINGGYFCLCGRFGKGENEGENKRISPRREEEIMIRSINDAAGWFRKGDCRSIRGRW